MSKLPTDNKHFNIRVPKSLWMFLKNDAATNESSMTDIIVACLEKYKKKIENKLTCKNTDV